MGFFDWLFGTSRKSFTTILSIRPPVFGVGSDSFWTVLKEGRRLRREKRFDAAERMFEKAATMARKAGVPAPIVDIEIARTWWHAGKLTDAVKRCEALLPDLDAGKLLASIYRERAKERTKAGDIEQALAAWQRVQEVARRVDSRILTATDRKAIKNLKIKSS